MQGGRFGEARRSMAKASMLWLRDRRRLERLLDRLTNVAGEATRYSHRLVVPAATLSPWYDDTEFRRTYEAVADHTHVDLYRCWELWSTLGQLASTDGDVLEVGVWRGGTGALLAARAHQLGLAAPVHLCDTFAGVVKAGDEDPWYRGGEHADTSVTIVEDLLGRLGLRATLHHGVFPDDTAGEFDATARFRLVHVDVDVYESARGVVEWVWPRLAVGGALVFDDFGFFECEGVATYGTALLADNPALVRGVHNLNGHLVVFKLAEGALCDTARSC